jgi:hypothetical protein
MGHRFPPEIIQYAVWLYQRFSLSHPDIEEKKKHQGFGDTFFIDAVFVVVTCGVRITILRRIAGDFKVLSYPLNWLR